MPLRTHDALPPARDAEWSETQVEPQQARNLLKLIGDTESMSGCMVEIGSWRGESIAWMAASTSRNVVAVDPWIGDSNQVNYKAFKDQTSELSNVVVERKPFDQAVREWTHGPASFAFIDAAHDYVNVAHELSAARRILEPGGLVAFHDSDNIAFAGGRRALFEVAERFELVAHIPNLTVFRVFRDAKDGDT